MKKSNIVSISLISVFLLAGCATKETIDVDAPPQSVVPPKFEQQPVKRKGSLYSRKGASLFADKKDLQVGDIIIVDIYEKFDTKNKGTRDNDQTTNSNSQGGVFADVSGGAGTANTASKLNSVGLGLGFTTASTNDFTATTENSTNDYTKTTISAMIDNIYANGNYFIVGSKEFLINGEKQIVKISGIIRPYDISSDNSIESKNIANLKIFYTKAGEGTEVLDKRWGTKALESVWPF